MKFLRGIGFSVVAIMICTMVFSGGASAATTYTIYVSDDTFVEMEIGPPWHNYGDWHNLTVALSIGGGADTYLKFDLSVIPDDHIITSIVLWLYNYKSISGIWMGATHNNANVIAYHVDDDTWDEMTVTWNNRPPYTSLLGTETDSGENKWYSWDLMVTSYDYSGDLVDDDLSIALVEAPITPDDFGISEYYSREKLPEQGYPYRPYLVVEAYRPSEVPELPLGIPIITSIALVAYLAIRKRIGKKPE